MAQGRAAPESHPRSGMCWAPRAENDDDDDTAAQVLRLSPKCYDLGNMIVIIRRFGGLTSADSEYLKGANGTAQYKVQSTEYRVQSIEYIV